MGRAPSTAALAVALVVLLGACTASNPSLTPSPVPTHEPGALNVTALLDLSGPRAPNGGPQRDALQLWADQHSSATPRVKLKVVDVGGSPSKTVLELRRAAVEDRADAIIIGVALDYDDAFENAVQLTQIPVLFTLPIRDPGIHGGWAFALAPTPEQLAGFLLDDALQRLLRGGALVVSDESTTAIVERRALVAEMERRRVTPNAMTVTAADATQKLRPLLGSTSIVFLAGTPRSYLDAVRTVPVGSTVYLSYLSELGEIADLREAASLAVWPGSRWVAAGGAAAAAENAVARVSFAQAYAQRAGPPTSVAASAYDALALLSRAATGGLESAGVRDRLESGTFTGVATTYAFSASRHAGFKIRDLALLRYVSAGSSPAIR